MPTPILSVLLASSSLLLGSAQPADDASAEANAVSAPADGFESPRELLDALAERDRTIESLSGDVRYTVINALENDRQMRLGKLAIRNNAESESASDREYAVSFSTLEIDRRREQIAEHYIFDGRWFVERLPEEKQFNKRELVPKGETLDPMELMRDAPFWVSLGRDQDRLLAAYDAELLDQTEGLVDNPDFPELKFLADLPHVQNTTQLILTPKPGSGFEDDWEWVRIWTDNETLLPVLYIKSEWTGDLQIVELFETETNTEIPAGVFDTASPPEGSGWRVQISRWRGDDTRQTNQPEIPTPPTPSTPGSD